MTATRPIRAEDYDAFIFDLDGVLTHTAHVHSAAWKELFDEYLKKVAEAEGKPFVPFEDDDYFQYVDGKPRYDGVKSFLASRGIELPWGSPDDTPDKETVCGLGNKKNALYNEYIGTKGVHVFRSTEKLIRDAKARGVRVAVVTASKNCPVVLSIAKLEDLFEKQVDGNYAAENKLPGKPQGDTFVEAAHLLGTTPERSVVFEDAIAGVQAGRHGKFKLVVGIDRTGIGEELAKNGADIVVKDLEELELQ